MKEATQRKENKSPCPVAIMDLKIITNEKREVKQYEIKL
jgi:hypothetical protein